MRLRSGRVIGVRRVIGCPATMPMHLRLRLGLRLGLGLRAAQQDLLLHRSGCRFPEFYQRGEGDGSMKLEGERVISMLKNEADLPF